MMEEIDTSLDAEIIDAPDISDGVHIARWARPPICPNFSCATENLGYRQ